MILCPWRSVSMRPSTFTSSESSSNRAHGRRLKVVLFSVASTTALPCVSKALTARRTSSPSAHFLSVNPSAKKIRLVYGTDFV